MQRMVLTRIGSFLALAIFLASTPATAQNEIRILSESAQDPVAKALETGKGLEHGGRWGEAVTHYEELLRQFPKHQAVRQRLDLSKMRYDLARRYSDRSFRESLLNVDPRRAIETYSEVLLKINAHYVNKPRWDAIVARGVRLIDVALSDKKFAQQNLRNVAPNRIDAFREEMFDNLASRVIRSRQDALDAVSAMIRLAQSHLGLSPTTITMEFICAAAGGLDDYSTYLSSDQLREVYSQIEGNFVGLGVELKARDGGLLLVHIIPGSPAEKAGLRAGHRIIAVDGQNTSEMNTDEAATMLQGPEGSMVEVTVVASGEPARKIRLRREHVEVPSVEETRIVDRAMGVGYLHITGFQKTTVRDLDAALWKLHRQGMRSLIVDVRGNPGGLLTTSVEIADKFLEQGIIVSTRGRSANEDYDYRAHRQGTWRVPLIVLIDGNSASASEIFAGAMHDNHRGTLVGTRSYGKGSVQGIFPLNFAGAGIRLTTAKFYSPQGRPISKVGVHPDIVVRHAAKATGEGKWIDAEEDVALQAAVEAARQKLAVR